MAKTIACDIVSAESHIYSGEAEMLIATGIYGDLGITPGHAALLTQLKPGPIRVILDGEEEDLIFYLSGGMLEVQPKLITVLADTAVRANDIDESAAIEAKNKALADLQKHQAEIDYGSAAARLAEAAAQLRTLQQIRKKMGH